MAIYDISIQDLQIVNEHQRAYPLIGRTFKAFTIWTKDPGKFQEFNLLVDLASGTVETDVNAIADQERAAYQAKYGKLTLKLYERLQTIRDDELLPIAVWLASDPAARTQDEIFASLADQFLGAAEALAKSGVPWAVDNASMAEEIRQAYFSALSEDAIRQLQPLADQMKGQGVEVTTLEPLPSLAARLSKSAILALQEREGIDRIYLLEMKPEPALVEAAGTDRMPQAWYQGNLTGSGRRIAVLEPSNILQNTNCLNIIATRTGVPPTGWAQIDIEHKTHVASILACNNSIYRGIAYNASVIDAGYDSANFNPDFATGVQWAIQTQNADVVNVSLQTDAGQALQWEDRVLDYWADYGLSVIVVAAGNNTTNVTSPSKGWNVITVGASDDRGNSDWGDDVMAGFSNYKNPNPTPGDHEKPDLVAPGVNITRIGPGGTPTTYLPSGTSFAAPQVAGLAALLMNRNGALVDRPEAVKAVLMASAVHNIQDSRWMPSGQDLRDGAGSIDAALADQTATLGYGSNNNIMCDRPCWWATDDRYVPPGGWFTRSFQASRGERIRVAIAWLSHVDPSYLGDNLGVNYNLRVVDSSNNQVTDGYSASWDNSNELVEFVAPGTGTYTIQMLRSSSDTQPWPTRIGIAWTKQATYLPDVRRNDNGWDSTLTLRNDGAEPRDVTVTYFFPNGNFAASRSYATEHSGNLLQPNAAWTTELFSSFPNFQGSAVVDGSEDVSVVVETTGSGTYGYAGMGSLSRNGGTPASTLHIPAVFNDYYGWYSDVAVQNTGATSVGVTIAYYDSAGGSTGSAYAVIPSQGRHTFSGAGNGAFSAAVISTGLNTAQIAATAYHHNGNVYESHTAFSAGASTLFAPIIMNSYYGWATALTVQNVGSAATTVYVDYYNEADGFVKTTLLANVPVRGYRSLYTPSEGIGTGLFSARIRSSGQPIVAVVTESYGNPLGKGMAYEAIPNGGHGVRFPLLVSQYGSDNRVSSVVMQNASGGSTTATLRLFNSNGTNQGNPLPSPTVSPWGLYQWYLPAHVSGAFMGSGTVTANGPQPIVAVGNYDAANPPNMDRAFSISGILE